MTTREKYLFRELANERKNQEAIKELKSIGVGDEILNDSNFKDFANKFDPSRTTTKEIYEMYKKMLPPKEAPKPIASMKNSDSSADVIKDFYTKDEASKFTRADLIKIRNYLKLYVIQCLVGNFYLGGIINVSKKLYSNYMVKENSR